MKSDSPIPTSTCLKELRLNPPMSRGGPSELSGIGGGDIGDNGGGEHDTMGGTNLVPSIWTVEAPFHTHNLDMFTQRWPTSSNSFLKNRIIMYS